MVTKELLAKVRRIEIRTRRIVDELTGGAYHSVFKGRGIEFDEVREYIVGDDVRSIDWNVTARMGHPYIKKFVEERELTVFLLVDISASGDFGSVAQRKRELFTELAAVLAFSAVRNNDQAGLILFSDFDELYLPPRKGRQHVLRLIRELLVYQRRHRRTNIARALETFMRVSRRRAIVFLISDFLDEGFEHALSTANKYHDIVALRILDPVELALPRAGIVNLEDAESGECLTVPSSQPAARLLYADQAGAYHDNVLRDFRRAGVDAVDIRNGEDYILPIMRFFHRRQRT